MSYGESNGHVTDHVNQSAI